MGSELGSATEEGDDAYSGRPGGKRPLTHTRLEFIKSLKNRNALLL